MVLSPIKEMIEDTGSTLAMTNQKAIPVKASHKKRRPSPNALSAKLIRALLKTTVMCMSANILKTPTRYVADGILQERRRSLSRNPAPKNPTAIRAISSPHGSGNGISRTLRNPNAVKNAKPIGREDLGTKFIVANKMT